MFLEYWMILILALFWILSIIHITNNNTKEAFKKGVFVGIEGTLRALEKNGIITIDDQTGLVSGHSEASIHASDLKV